MTAHGLDWSARPGSHQLGLVLPGKRFRLSRPEVRPEVPNARGIRGRGPFWYIKHNVHAINTWSKYVNIKTQTSLRL